MTKTIKNSPKNLANTTKSINSILDKAKPSKAISTGDKSTRAINKIKNSKSTAHQNSEAMKGGELYKNNKPKNNGNLSNVKSVTKSIPLLNAVGVTQKKTKIKTTKI